MTCSGELYIDEDCRDAFEKELNDVFGKNWYLSGCSGQNLDEISGIEEVEVNDEDGKQIGEAIIYSEKAYNDDVGVVLTPIAIQIKKENKIVYDGLQKELDSKYEEMLDRFDYDLKGWSESDIAKLASIASDINLMLRFGAKRT